MTFNEAFRRLIGHEGGYVNDPADPGGETNFGISRRAYPGEDIKHMTLQRAKALYLRDYWGPAGCDAVPDAMRFQLFDMAVNSGVRRALETLQLAAGVDPDGQLGPLTLQALQTMPPARLIARFNGHRLEFLTSLNHWERFGKGWSRRIASNLKDA